MIFPLHAVKSLNSEYQRSFPFLKQAFLLKFASNLRTNTSYIRTVDKFHGSVISILQVIVLSIGNCFIFVHVLALFRMRYSTVSDDFCEDGFSQNHKITKCVDLFRILRSSHALETPSFATYIPHSDINITLVLI